jgi:2-aminophenol/2-amino-5-chlorophenol 1,6-dioxygenase alpha subunit
MKSEIRAFMVPGLPHVLKPELNSHYQSLNRAMVAAGHAIREFNAARILYYSTQWISVLGHSVQSGRKVEGVHVDENWHQFATLPFSMHVDQPFAAACVAAAARTGFQARSIDYQNFPIDTGTIVADSLLNKDHLPMSAISCCVYADYAATVRLAEEVRSVLTGKERTAVVISSGLSQRFFTEEIDMREDRWRDPEDEKRDREFVAQLEKSLKVDVKTYAQMVKGDMGLKALAFAQGLGFQKAKAHAIGAIYGSGAAVLEFI